MAGITALTNIVRRQAAFGGIMGRDGRRQYGGGSDMGQVPDSDGNVGPEDTTEFIQISPQKIKLKLRVGQTSKVQFRDMAQFVIPLPI